jgi:flavin-dependent dehydrogenase
MKSWPIPARTKRGKFHAGRVLVCGDAAGLADPLTGEGIYYAIRSGKLAAAACVKFLQGADTSVSSYSDSVNQLLMPELIEANRIKYLFNSVPLKIHNFVRSSDRAWSAYCKILRGERNYADARKGFGRWKILWTVTCRMAQGISFFKEKRFRKAGF